MKARFKLWFAFLAALLLASLPQNPAHAGEHVLSFETTLVIQKNGTLDVIERIEVEVSTEIVTQGFPRLIYAKHPSKREDPRAKGPLEFEIVSIQRDGKAEPYTMEDYEVGTWLTVGPSHDIQTNRPIRYEIHYRITGSWIGLWHDDRDFFQWEIDTQDGYEQIDKAAIVVSAPPGAAFDFADAIYDPSKGKSPVVQKRSTSSRLILEATGLVSGHSLLATVTWPKDLVPKPE